MKSKSTRLSAATPAKAVSWAEAILDDLERLDEGPDIIPLPPDSPEWVQKVSREVLKTIYPKQAIKPGQITPSSVGLFLGRHYALHAMLFTEELPLGPKTEQQAEALLKKNGGTNSLSRAGKEVRSADGVHGAPAIGIPDGR